MRFLHHAAMLGSLSGALLLTMCSNPAATGAGGAGPPGGGGSDASTEDAWPSPDGGTLLASGQANPGSLAVDKTHVYWLDGGGGGTPASVMRVPIGGGTPTRLATAQSPSALALDATRAYWEDNGSIFATPLEGGAVTRLAAGQSLVGSIAVDAESVYWRTVDWDSGLGAVMKAPIGGGAPTQLASTHEGVDWGLLVKDGNVYWADDGIWMVSADGGTPAMIAAATTTYPLGAITADTTSVYWIRARSWCRSEPGR